MKYHSLLKSLMAKMSALDESKPVKPLEKEEIKALMEESNGKKEGGNK